MERVMLQLYIQSIGSLRATLHACTRYLFEVEIAAEMSNMREQNHEGIAAAPAALLG